MKMIRTLLCFLILLPSAGYSFDLYVHSTKAPLFKEPAVDSEKIAEIKKGTLLQGIGENGNWYNVKHENLSGWIFKLIVKKTKPVDKKDISKDQVSELSEKARKRPSAFSTTAAARGLKDQRERPSDKYILDYESLEQIESIEISDEEAETFLKQGVANE